MSFSNKQKLLPKEDIIKNKYLKYINQYLLIYY